MSKLLDKILKSNTIDEAAVLSESKFFNDVCVTKTEIPIINIALSGDLDGGLTAGNFMIAGPSKHFKTLQGLITAKAYLDKYDDAVIVLYDSEWGAPLNYFISMGIPPEKIVHKPITNIEKLKHDISNLLESLDRGDHVMIFIDSLGNLASKKEVEDAQEGKSVADMTRAKAIKSLFRIIGALPMIKDIPIVTINHTYKEMSMFPKDIVSGGTGSYYNASIIWIIGRQQETEETKVDGKKKTELTGYNFTITIEKSRYVKEKSKFNLTVTFDGGINKYSGLFDIAHTGGFVVKNRGPIYLAPNYHGEKQFSSTDTEEFWGPILKDKAFKDYVKKTYSLGETSMVSSTEIVMDDDE